MLYDMKIGLLLLALNVVLRTKELLINSSKWQIMEAFVWLMSGVDVWYGN